MGVAPIGAIKKVLDRAGMTIKDVDVVELNEAFAAQVIPIMAECDIPLEKLNTHGGAIALGHPFGMTGPGSWARCSTRWRPTTTRSASRRCASPAGRARRCSSSASTDAPGGCRPLGAQALDQGGSASSTSARAFRGLRSA